MYGVEWLTGPNLNVYTLEEAKLVEPRIEGFLASGARRLHFLSEIVQEIAKLIHTNPRMREVILLALGVTSPQP